MNLVRRIHPDLVQGVNNTIFKMAFVTPWSPRLHLHSAATATAAVAVGPRGLLPASRTASNQQVRQPSRLHMTASPTPTSTPTPTPTPSPTLASTPKTSPSGKLTLLYDGECPLCLREVAMLRKRSDARGGTLTFVDIANSDDFDEGRFGVSYETAMGRIYGMRSDGVLVDGVEVFRLAYDAVGLGWVYAFAKWPPALWLADRVYDVWADRRLQWTGRGTLEAVIRARDEKRTCR